MFLVECTYDVRRIDVEWLEVEDPFVVYADGFYCLVIYREVLVCSPVFILLYIYIYIVEEIVRRGDGEKGGGYNQLTACCPFQQIQALFPLREVIDQQRCRACFLSTVDSRLS